MKQPHEYERRILLTVTGLSPQVVTETIYSLVHQDEPFVPTEVHLITTEMGAQQAELSLLSADEGWFHRLIEDYQLGPIAFSAEQIYVVRDALGKPLVDIRSPEDNLLAADYITQVVRQLTADDNCALHVSIAGGRKTMGFFLGYALSLYGRQQDSLSHVLVSEPFESSRDFFYPSRQSRVIVVRGNQYVDCKDAEVTLADIPFVRLRLGMPQELLQGDASYRESVSAVNVQLNQVRLVIDRRNRLVNMAGITFRLPPVQLALLCLFAEHRLSGEKPLSAPSLEVGDELWAELFLRQLRLILTKANAIDGTEDTLKSGMDGDYFSQLKSKLHSSIKKTLSQHTIPQYIVTQYFIGASSKRPYKYQLIVLPENIEFASLK